MPYKTYQEGSRRSTRAIKDEPVKDFLYFAKCSLVGGYVPYTLLLTVETSLWGVKTKCCHVREEQIFKSKTVPSYLG